MPQSVPKRVTFIGNPFGHRGRQHRDAEAIQKIKIHRDAGAISREEKGDSKKVIVLSNERC